MTLSKQTPPKPHQSPPVSRALFLSPEKSALIDPATCVDLASGRPGQWFSVIMDIRHGANYNDPAGFANRSYQQVMHSSWCGFGNTSLFF